MIYLTKSGFRKSEWNGDIGTYEDIPIKSIEHELRSSCMIEDGVTLGDIFRAVEQSDILCAVIGVWAWCDCGAFHEEMRQPVSTSTLKCLVIGRTAAIEKDGEFVYGLEVVGRDGTDTIWAIDFTPVNELRDVPVKLAEFITMWDYRQKEPWSQEVKISDYSLLDVLGALYYEVSFHGSPAERNEKCSQVVDAANAVKDGTAKLVTLDEVLKKETIQ